MTKYFDKLIAKDQILYSLLSITWKHENNVILGHVDLFLKFIGYH
jgi:hypothetical protein